jgi:hypothetical protein
MSALRVFVGKHPCDDLPYIHDVDPDPRTGDERFTFDGPDYSGWYVRQEVTEEMVEVAHKSLEESCDRFTPAPWKVRRALEAALFSSDAGEREKTG